MKCKNNPKKSYKGTEPSPKGLGWCASGESIGKKRKGKDGNMWIVKKTKTSKRWVRCISKKPLKRNISTMTKTSHKKSKIEFTKVSGMLPLPLDISKFVTYRRHQKPSLFSKFETTTTIYGLQFEPNKIHQMMDLNCFAEKAIGIPWGFKKINNPTRFWLQKDAYDPSRSVLQKTDAVVKEVAKEHKGWKYYFIHDNGGRPFIVYIKGKCVDIYTRANKSHTRFVPNFVWSKNMSENKWQYVNHVKSYTNVVKAWIGQSPKTQMTSYSGGYGQKFLGNSILLTLPKNNNIFIGGHIVLSFKTPTPITEFWSPVGNNDVPYPVAFTSKNAYFLLDDQKVDLNKFKRKLTLKDKQDLYTIFYGHDKEQLLINAERVKKPFHSKTIYNCDNY